MLVQNEEKNLKIIIKSESTSREWCVWSAEKCPLLVNVYCHLDHVVLANRGHNFGVRGCWLVHSCKKHLWFCSHAVGLVALQSMMNAMLSQQKIIDIIDCYPSPKAAQLVWMNILLVGPRTLLTEFGIHHRLKSCMLVYPSAGNAPAPAAQIPSPSRFPQDSRFKVGQEAIWRSKSNLVFNPYCLYDIFVSKREKSLKLLSQCQHLKNGQQTHLQIQIIQDNPWHSKVLLHSEQL